MQQGSCVLERSNCAKLPNYILQEKNVSFLKVFMCPMVSRYHHAVQKQSNMLVAIKIDGNIETSQRAKGFKPLLVPSILEMLNWLHRHQFSGIMLSSNDLYTSGTAFGLSSLLGPTVFFVIMLVSNSITLQSD